MKRTYLVLIITMLVIGFAAVATNLIFNGKLNIGFNAEDFQVYFSNAKLDGVENKDLISSDGKKITFESKKLIDVDSTSILEYEITNNSKQYDAEVKIECTPSETEYIKIENNLNSSSIAAQTEETGTLTIRLKTLTTEEKTENITCTLEVSAVSRTSKETQKVEETYSIGAYLYDQDSKILANKHLVVYSTTPHYVETDNTGYFYVEGLERGTHEIYYLGEESGEGKSKEEIKKMASDSAEITTESKEIIFKENKVTTNKTSIGKESEVTRVRVEAEDRTYSKVIEKNKVEFDIPTEGYTTMLCNKKINLTEEEIIKLDNVTEDTECKLYKNLVDAMNDHNTNNRIGTIIMLNDDQLSDGLNISNELYFNLNGKQIVGTSSDGLLDNFASATYYDTKNSGKIISTQLDGITISGENVVVNTSINIESARSAVRIYNEGTNSTMNITGGNIVCNNTEQDFCLYTSSETETMNIKNTNIKSTYGGLQNNGKVVLENVTIDTENVNVIENRKTITIESGTYNSEDGIILKNFDTATINGGVFISQNNFAIKNETGIINIIQTDKPIYISTKLLDWKTVINNVSNMNIKGNIADKCTNNAEDTTSGLCVYAEGDRTGNKTSNGAIQNVSSGYVNIDGGSYYGYHQGINNHAGGVINIKNAYVFSKTSGVLNNSTGTINICSSVIESEKYHLFTTTGIINYASSVNFKGISTTLAYGASNLEYIKLNYSGTCSLGN